MMICSSVRIGLPEDRKWCGFRTIEGGETPAWLFYNREFSVRGVLGLREPPREFRRTQAPRE